MGGLTAATAAEAAGFTPTAGAGVQGRDAAPRYQEESQVAKKKTGKTSVASQHPDSKGSNIKRDSARGQGAAAVGAFATGQGGSGQFRKKRKGGE